jgi:hypothetical protein
MPKRNLDRRKETSYPEQSISRGRGIDIFASTRQHRVEIAAAGAKQQIIEHLKPITHHLRGLKEMCQKMYSRKGERFCKELGVYPFENTCNTLIDHIEGRETNGDPITAATQIVEFLEKYNPPDMRRPNEPDHIQNLAQYIKNAIHPFIQHTQQENDIRQKKQSFLEKIEKPVISEFKNTAQNRSLDNRETQKETVRVIYTDIYHLCNQIMLERNFFSPNNTGSMHNKYGNPTPDQAAESAIRLRELLNDSLIRDHVPTKTFRTKMDRWYQEAGLS